MKIRDISDTFPGASPRNDISWSVRDPGSAALLADTAWASPFRQHLQILPRPSHLHMSQLEYNYPGITGYSAASGRDHLCMLQAHREGRPDPDYNWSGKSFLFHWIYMPINPGEYVTEVWVCPPFGVHRANWGLVFVTNRGKHTSFSSWRPKPTSPDRPYICIQKKDRHRAALYFAAFEWKQRLFAVPGTGAYHAHLALEKTERVETREWPSSFVPVSPTPLFNGDSLRQYFSSCRLEDVVEVPLSGKLEWWSSTGSGRVYHIRDPVNVQE